MQLNAPQADIFRHAASRYLLMKGQGGGKTFDMGIISAMLVSECPNALGMIATNTYKQLSDTTLKEVFKVWDKFFGWKEWSAEEPNGVYVIDKQRPACFNKGLHVFASNAGKLHLRNGSVIMTASLENYTAIEGQTLGWAMLDETADTEPEAVKEIITGRLRERSIFLKKGHDPKSGLFPFTGNPESGENFNPLYIFTKPAKLKWLNDWFDIEKDKDKIIGEVLNWRNGRYYFRKEKHRVVVIASAMFNVPVLGEKYFEDRIAELLPERVDFLIHGVPFAREGNEYAGAFNSSQHVRPTNFKDGYPIHFTVDFNAKPYMSGLIIQLVPGNDRIECRVLSEYALASPKNSAGALMGEFMRGWGHLCDFGLYIYGDSSGNNTLAVMESKSLFFDLEKAIDPMVGYEKRVPSHNPFYAGVMGKGTMGRRDFLNALLLGSLDVDIIVDPSCKELIADLTYCKEDANGKLLKKKNKEGVEERGHHIDALQYFLCHPKALGHLSKRRPRNQETNE